MMTTRILPFEEWPKLNGTEAEQLWPKLDPNDACFIVVEEDGKIVGEVALMRRWCADAVWLHPDCRHGGVARQLWAAVERLAPTRGADVLLVPVTRSVMRRFFALVGAIKLPGDIFVWALKRRSS